ncbi:L,D-transpeptidase [Metabacillus iocasae]|uniref:Lipoprotein-anchoring transpeptidase ErfK/SrfK n=1 Tax=Priestia iocasae TaxID=2291674 RepID=A0ABS2QQD9_9BACI|nr:L,D-transpeptidase [Metabacillus iocasae]MBM7701615.1 lipoprotein-anchoring transpeptidase ErfK/SrfK [Metabacillus iocasae]
MNIFLILLVTMMSPIWPLGENPLSGDPFVIVNKQTNELAYIQNGHVERVSKVATGKTEDLTPEGEFTVVVKAKNPYYRRGKIEGGSPENPLGTRWIGFDARETDGRIYGVHGTNQPDSIGKFVSNGCIRMQKEQVEELYEKIPIGAKILIVKSNQSFEEIVKERGL